MKVLVLTVVLMLAAVPMFAQSVPSSGAFGIGAQLSGSTDPKTPNSMMMSNGLNGVYCVTNNITLLAGFNLLTQTDVGTVFAFDMGGYYRFSRGQFTPIAEALIFIGVDSPSSKIVKDAKSTTVFGFDFLGGGEYYFNKNFAMQLTEGVEFHTEPSTFGLVTKLGLTFYFGS